MPPLELDEDTSIEISLSIGCTIYQPVSEDLADANWLIDQADQSMFQAKKSGGDSVSFQKFIGKKRVETAQLAKG